jgi:hypothetical protein
VNGYVEDAKRTEILGKAIADLAEQSVSLTGSGDGESSVRDHIGTTQDYFTATKNFTQSPENKEHVATLESPNATPEQKQAAYTALANAIATYMGVDPTQAKVLMASDPQFAGAYSRDTGIIYVNDAVHDTATAAVTTVGHETQHYLDNQQNPDAVQSPQYQGNREEYADIMGNATADYLNFNFAQNNYALAGSNTHSLGTTASDILSNINTLTGNQQQFNKEDPNSLDHSVLRAVPAIEQGLSLAVLGAVALSGDEDAKKQLAQDVESLIKDVNTVLGRDSASKGTIDAEYLINELIALKVKEEQVKDSGSLDYRKLNEIEALRSTLTANLSPESRSEIEKVVSGFVSDVLNGPQTSSGGFQAATEPVITALPNPVLFNPGLLILDNTPPEIPGQIGGFEIGEILPDLTGTPVLEGHWSDSIYLSESGVSGNDVALINGRKPINSEYAGKTHPSGVTFNEQGYPDFSPHAKAQVDINGLTGNYAKDAAMANKAVGLKSTPEGYVWHHVENGKTMQLIPKETHNAARHTGGAAKIRENK